MRLAIALASGLLALPAISFGSEFVGIVHVPVRVAGTAIANDLPLNVKPAHWPTNPAPSSYAIIGAQKQGGDTGALVHAFTRAVWAEERDIADDAVVRDILSANGYDPDLADKSLLAGAEEYASNLEEAINAGVFGAPFYVVGSEGFWGQDRLDHLDMHLAGKL